jgi:hypothetical protein
MTCEHRMLTDEELNTLPCFNITPPEEWDPRVTVDLAEVIPPLTSHEALVYTTINTPSTPYDVDETLNNTPFVEESHPHCTSTIEESLQSDYNCYDNSSEFDSPIADNFCFIVSHNDNNANDTKPYISSDITTTSESVLHLPPDSMKPSLPILSFLVFSVWEGLHVPRYYMDYSHIKSMCILCKRKTITSIGLTTLYV